MKLNRKLVLILSLVLSLALATGSTLAYLSDTDADVNVMTLGNVYIDQIEMERKEQSDSNTDSGNVTEFTQYKPLYPAVGEITWANEYQQWATGGSNQLFSDKLSNVVDKFVFVENTGSSPAYVRSIFAFEIGELSFAEWDKMIHLNTNAGFWTWDEATADDVVTIDGNNYVLMSALYTGTADVHADGVLPADETTRPSLLQLFLDSAATNDTVKAIDGNANGTYDVLVVSQAIQTEGFADAKTALDTGFGVVSATSHPWIDVDDPTDENDQDPDGEIEWPKVPVPGDDEDADYEVPADAYRVTSAAELEAAVAAGETTLLLAAGEYDIDGCTGKKLTLIGEDAENTIIVVKGSGQGEANGQLDYGFDSSTVTFQNLTIKTNNQTYAGYARLVGTYKNVTFENCYCLNSDSQFENCTFNVAGNQYNLWTWGAPTATFTNCTFNSDGKAILLYGTANTKLTLNSCLFNDTGVLPDLKAAVEIGDDYNKSYELIVNDTIVNGYEENDKGILTGSTLWANKNSMPSARLNVVIDGVDIY